MPQEPQVKHLSRSVSEVMHHWIWQEVSILKVLVISFESLSWISSMTDFALAGIS